MWITCGLLWCFNQLFGISLWRHPFTGEDSLVGKRLNVKSLWIFFDEWTNSSTSWEYIFSKLSFFVWTVPLNLTTLLWVSATFKSNQIKSNHFYCHITTAQVPWWVKFLWACSRQCKKNNKQFTYGQTVQKKKKTALEHLQCSRQCKKTTTTIYIWTVHIYRLYRRQCAKYTYIYSVHIVYYKDILSYQLHIIHRMGTSALCTVSIHNVVYT